MLSFLQTLLTINILFLAYLEIEIECVWDVDVAGREAHVLPHEVGEGAVSIRRIPLRQED